MLKLERMLARVEATVAVGCLAAMVILSFAQILARNLFNTGLPGTDILLRYLVLVVAFFGAILAVREQRHIRLDVLSTLMPLSWRHHLQIFFHGVSAVVCGALGWAAVRYWREEWHYAMPGDRWTAALSVVLPVSLALLSFHFLLRAWIEARGLDSDP
ncbi:MAG TPA: TRAP transporter small permease [Gammaproteobacteria bacterium]|nr:TRAP transporter small permease [Gammaproteobacteria bacterium]